MKKLLLRVSNAFLAILFMLVMFVGVSFASEKNDNESTTVRIHYDRSDIDGWDVWAWADGVEASSYQFNSSDGFGYIAEFKFDKKVEVVNYIIRKNDWSSREPSNSNDGSRTVAVNNGVAEDCVKSSIMDITSILIQEEDLNQEHEEATLNPKPTNEKSEKRLIVHFDNPTKEEWAIWAWPNEEEGNEYTFDSKDGYGLVSNINLGNINTNEIGITIKSPGSWDRKDISNDRIVDLNKGNEIWLKSGDSNVYYKKPDDKIEKLNSEDLKESLKTITIHFDNPKDENWNLWLWPKNGEGKEYNFTEKDGFGYYTDISITTKENEFGFLIKDPNWTKDYDSDRFIDLNKGDEVWIKSKDPKVYYENPDSPPVFYSKLNADIKLKSYNKDKLYRLKAWTDKDDESKAKYFYFDNEGKYLLAKTKFVSLKGKDLRRINFKLEEIDNSGNVIRSEDKARFIKNFNENGYAEIYIIESDPKIYKDETSIEDNKISRISIDDYKTIRVKFAKPTNLNELINNGYDFVTNSNLSKENIVSVEAIDKENLYSSELEIKFDRELDIEKDYKFTFFLDKDHQFPIEGVAVIGNVVSTKEFDDKFYYDGKLGSIYTPYETIFQLWAPSASKVELIAYINNKEIKIPMERMQKGVYKYTLSGDYELLEYQYDVHFKDGTINRVVDPYSKSTTKNGEKSVVVNPKKSIIERPARDLVKNPIIYELHVRDLSNQKQSGIKNKGKFLGLTEKGTKTPSGQKTGIDYIKDLGVTHIQLLPIYDFSKYSVDEDDPLAKFNWGYDPVNYNVPEGAYSTNPDDPYNRINEMQAMIDSVHKEGMGVIMDVVYNHVYSIDEHSFNKIVPGYYFRFDENGIPLNGTGVGNEIASERKMVRKYIVDSVVYLAETYKLDGFRFDLMGILDLDTMNEIDSKLREINPDILLLGEGWDMGNHPKEIRSAQTNAFKMPNIATFNDDLRDGVKGSAFDGDAIGFVNGEDNEERLFNQIKTQKSVNDYKFYDNPRQLIQYTEAHDNKTSWDKIKEIYPNEDDAITLKRQRLATTIPLLSQGVPFIHAGQEFARTKEGNENSYNASAEINELDWLRAEKYKDNVDYIREIIAIRKNEPLFWSETFDQVNSRVHKIVANDGLIAFKMTDGKRDIYIAFNRDNTNKSFKVNNGTYYIFAKEDKANRNGLDMFKVTNGTVKVAPMSTLIFKSEINHDKEVEFTTGTSQKEKDYLTKNQTEDKQEKEVKQKSVGSFINNKKSEVVGLKHNNKNEARSNHIAKSNNPRTGISGIDSTLIILISTVSTLTLVKKKK